MTRFYIYIHRKPDGTPFYVGKGHGKRAYKRTNRNPHHTAILAKYGDAVIIDIIHAESEQHAFQLEREHIAMFRDHGYRLANQTDGGDGVTGLIMSDEAKQKMAQAKIGKKQKPEHIAKRSASRIGMKMSEECLQKRSQAFKGREVSPEHRAKISKTLTGTTDSLERKINKGNAARGKAKAINTTGLVGLSWCESKKSWECRLMVMGKCHRKRHKCLLDAVSFIYALQREYLVV